MLSRIRNKSKIRNTWFYFNLIVFGVFFFAFACFYHYGLDDYLPLVDIESLHYNAVQNGRFALMVVYDFLIALQINPILFQHFFGICLIVTLAICSSAITKNIIKTNFFESKTSQIIVNIGSVLLFANIFVAEWFTFVLSYPQWILAVFSSVYGAILISADSKKKKILGLFLLLVAANSYQLALGYYAFLVMLFIFFKHKKDFHFGQVLKESIIAGVYAVGSIAVNIILMKILTYAKIIGQESRYNQLGISIENFKTISKGQYSIWIDGKNLMPGGIMAIVMIFTLLMLLYLCYREKVKKSELLFCCLILASGQLVVYFPQILSVPWLTPRSLAPLFGLYSINMYLIAYWSKSHCVCQKITMCIAVFFLIINFSCVQKMAVTTFQTNALDQMYTSNITATIKNYEKQNNKTVKYIGFCNDLAPQYKYDEVCVQPPEELFTKAYVVDWANIYAFNFYSGLNLKKVDVPEEIKSHFGKYNWDEFYSNEQIVFCDETIYICVY